MKFSVKKWSPKTFAKKTREKKHFSCHSLSIRVKPYQSFSPSEYLVDSKYMLILSMADQKVIMYFNTYVESGTPSPNLPHSSITVDID